MGRGQGTMTLAASQRRAMGGYIAPLKKTPYSLLTPTIEAIDEWRAQNPTGIVEILDQSGCWRKIVEPARVTAHGVVGSPGYGSRPPSYWTHDENDDNGMEVLAEDIVEARSYFRELTGLGLSDTSSMDESSESATGGAGRYIKVGREYVQIYQGKSIIRRVRVLSVDGATARVIGLNGPMQGAEYNLKLDGKRDSLLTEQEASELHS